MSTAASWSELRGAAVDLGALLRLRLRGRGRLVLVGSALAAALTWLFLRLAVASADQVVAERPDLAASLRPEVLLAPALLGLLLITIVSAVAGGGGREVLPAAQAIAFPISPTTESLGALLLTPLNLAWLLQSGLVIGLAASHAAYPWVAGPLGLLVVIALTAVGQCVGWLAEGVRRGGAVGVAAGPWLVRVTGWALGLGGALVVWVGGGRELQAASGAAATAGAIRGSSTLDQVALVVVLLLLTAGGVGLGAKAAEWAMRHPTRQEADLESRPYPSRAFPAGTVAALLRVERPSLWRSVPLRRGLLMIALLPASALVIMDAAWASMALLPGLIGSGAAMLFGVNMWCLDGRGGLWTHSLPVEPAEQWWARVRLLVEALVAALAPSAVLGLVRLWPVGWGECLGLALITVVVLTQIVASCALWSVRSPYAADLRSARATPAPPLAMLGYSLRLALGSTLTGLVLALSYTAGPWWATTLLVAVLLARAGWRLHRARRRWLDPHQRARVLAAVTT